jgi:hypothetical protein
MGCYEFLVDIGITELITPTNECFHPEQDSVTVYIKKFGDLPFEDIDIALQIDGGPVRIESIPGTIETDLVYTFDTLINISTPRPQRLTASWVGRTHKKKKPPILAAFFC